ncbi:hydrogenase nickel incorporation protein HypB [Clostridium polynesiense]|uniref:hydrogenase nickel incorporation protein HypB n=1 Tax=Clostridium polynesiense TaxID=1325933 RepID=UPI00058AE005|nr:hydrogenase nickel incorporation protein HypB [Clostridium polynesiense]
MEIKVVRQILEWNQNCHDELQEELNKKKVVMINIMGSPGAGKTTFILSLINKLKEIGINSAVIEGDVAGQIDAETIASQGIPVVQLNTDGACHIEAMSIKNILPEFNLEDIQVIIVENIGNLVCPAEFDIGEHLKVALLSVPEGDDKVNKYPLMFMRSNALVITKYDMKDYFDYNEKRIMDEAKAVNKDIRIFKADSRKGTGVQDFVAWLRPLFNK